MVMEMLVMPMPAPPKPGSVALLLLLLRILILLLKDCGHQRELPYTRARTGTGTASTAGSRIRRREYRWVFQRASLLLGLLGLTLLLPLPPQSAPGPCKSSQVLLVRVLARRSSRRLRAGRTGRTGRRRGVGRVGRRARGGDSEEHGERVGEQCDEGAGHGADYCCGCTVAVYCLFLFFIFVNLAI